MKLYRFLMLHCTATKPGVKVTPDMIRAWHTAPKDLPGGGVLYMGKTYRTRAELPNDMMIGKPIQQLTGRGWSKVGYSTLITFDRAIKLVDYNEDEWIQGGEVTNGAAGMNSFSRHFSYVGGINNQGKPEDTRTEAQKFIMIELIKVEIEKNAQILVCGHNQFSSKACPSFNTVEWLRSEGIPEENIYKK